MTSRKLPAQDDSGKGFVGILAVELYFPENGSLKAKRTYLRRMRDTLHRRHGASFAEVGHQGLWQRARIVVAVAASDGGVLARSMSGVRAYLDSQDWAVVSCREEVIEVDED